MKGKNKKGYIHVVIGSIFAMLIVWFSGFSLRNFISIDGYTFSDEMRTNTSVYYSLASNRSSISGPLFSTIDRNFYKYIFENKTAFTLRPPSYVDFEEAEVEVVFKPLRQIDIDVEVRTDEKKYLPRRLYSYDPLNLQYLPGFMQSVFETHTVLSKNPDLDSNVPLKEAIHLAKDDTLSVYTNDINIQNNLYSFDIKESFSEKVALRGKHSLLTYSDGRPLSFSMTYIDINEKSGPDRLNLRIKRNGEILEYVQVADDGDETSGKIHSGVRKASIELEALEEGIYEIELDNSDDIVTQELLLSTQHLVAQGSLYLAPEFLKEESEQSDLYFNGRGLEIENLEENVDYSYRSYDKNSEFKSLSLENSSIKVSLEKGKYASFTYSSFLDLDSIEFVDRDERSKADFIIVKNDNAMPADRNGWITSRVRFNKDEIFMANGEIPLRFVVSGDNPLYFIDSIKTTLR